MMIWYRKRHQDQTKEPEWVRQLFKHLNTIQEKLNVIMATQADLLDGMDQIDAETNAIADLLTSLKDQISSGMTAAQADDVKARIDRAVTSLTGLAADPENPVPDPVV